MFKNGVGAGSTEDSVEDEDKENTWPWWEKIKKVSDQGIGIKGKEMALVWHEKASNCFANGFLITDAHSFGTETHMTSQVQNNIFNYNKAWITSS